MSDEKSRERLRIQLVYDTDGEIKEIFDLVNSVPGCSCSMHESLTCVIDVYADNLACMYELGIEHGKIIQRKLSADPKNS